jgi:hypothetical protein
MKKTTYTAWHAVAHIVKVSANYTLGSNFIYGKNTVG